MRKAVMAKITVVMTMMFLTIFAMSIPVKATPSPQELVVLTPMGRDITDPFEASFEAWYLGKTGETIDLVFLKKYTGDCFTLISTWAGSPEADVFFGGTTDYYKSLTASGLLAPYVSPEAGAIPEYLGPILLKDPEGYWYVDTFYGLGVIWNKAVMAAEGLPEPETWEDLLDPIYRGHITYTWAGRSGTTHNLVELFLQNWGDVHPDDGWAFWRRLSANLELWSEGSYGVFTAIKEGTVAIGIAQAENFPINAKLEGIDMGYSYLGFNTMVPSGIGLLAGTPNLEAAKYFIDFALSKEGQICLTDGGLIVSREDVHFSDSTAPRAVALKELLGVDSIWEMVDMVQSLDFELISSRYSDVNSIFDTTIREVHDELRAAWFAIEDAEATITDYEAQGYEVTEGLATISDAKGAFDAGNYALAEELAGAAVDTILVARIASLEEQVAALESERWLYAGVAGIAGLIIGALIAYMRRKE